MNCFDIPISEVIPPALTTALVLITLALAAAPYLAGQSIGLVNVPKVPRRFVSLLIIAGPVLVIVVALLLFVPLKVILRQDCSRVRNASAEQVIDDGPSPAPLYWTAGWWLPGAQVELATDQKHSGTRSFKLAAEKPNHLWWSQSVRLDPHSTYLLSAWIRAENVARSTENNDRGANVAIHFISPDKFPQSSEPLYDTAGEWRHVSLQFTTLTKTEAEVLLQLGADSGMTSGVAWFDDVTLEKVH
jgi:hypothetical protein